MNHEIEIFHLPNAHTREQGRLMSGGGQVFHLPLYLNSVSAGLPAPVDGHLDGMVDLNELLVDKPESTFLVRVQGDSMSGAGMYPGDLLIVERARNAKHNDIVIAMLDGELTLKRLKVESGGLRLVPENAAYAEIRISGEMRFEIMGIVKTVIHNLA